ncbi:MAG: low molecular weight protein-tyrosine-phosphatase [Candidatus Sericytochromatia bacterium]
MIQVLFVCLGNICRSTMAEGIFAHLVMEAGLSGQIQADSAGTANYHPGREPDARTLAVLTRYQIPYTHRARQVVSADFSQFDYILAMDTDNFAQLNRVAQSLPEAATARLEMMGRYLSEECAPIPDPYYEEDSAFEDVYQMLYPACQQLLRQIRQEHTL